MRKIITVIFVAIALFLMSCNSQEADLVVYNARIYNISVGFEVVEAMAIKDGNILAVGK